MASRGVEHNVLTDIANIQQILKGYQRGFPVIKELVQNAEDAGATVINIGWHPGFPQSRKVNSLLNGPAIFMLNNGPFTEEDREAICQVGFGTKGTNKKTIGRFGLGLKSVFHLCEAFFFMASSGTGSKHPDFVDIFNPWKGKYHAEWDQQGQDDETLLIGALENFLSKQPWFALWLPLRIRSHCNNGVHPIVSQWQDDLTSPPKDVREIFRDELQDTLPMLSKLREINYWVFNKHLQKWDLEYIVSFDSGSIRSLFPNKEYFEKRSINGVIKARSGEQKRNQTTSYGGIESCIDDPVFANLRDEEDWPTVLKTAEGQVREEKAKGVPHSCVYFTERKITETGRLRIKWSVFLPVGNEPEDISLRKTKRDISLFLHGFFFLNSNRTDIDGLGGFFRKDDTIYQKWNNAIVRSGTLPQLIPALDTFVKSSGLNNDEVSDITSAIAGSKLYDAFDRDICSQAQWLYVISDSGNGWKYLSENDIFYGVPASRGDLYEIPFNEIPSFKDIVNSYKVTIGNPFARVIPALTTRQCAYWTEDMILSLLSGIRPHHIPNDFVAEYFCRFVREEAQSEISNRLWTELEKVPLINTQSIMTRERRSINELKGLIENRLLFIVKNLPDRNTFALLQKVCHDLRLESMERKDTVQESSLNWIVDKRMLVPDLSDTAIGKTVLRAEQLGTLESRGRLFEMLAVSQDKERIVSTLRYLLHSSPQHRNAHDIIYLASVDEGSELWTRLMSAILEHRNEEWRMVDADLTRLIREADYQLFGLTRVGEETASSLLRDSVMLLHNIDLSFFSEGERARIMLDLSDDIVRSLPIHQRTNGSLISITPSCYLESDFKPDSDFKDQWDELLLRAIVIKRFSEPRYAFRQKELIPELDWNAVIGLALQSENPCRYGLTIMTALNKVGTPHKETLAFLKSTKWLMLSSGVVVSPDSIIAIDHADDEIYRLIGGLSGKSASVNDLQQAIKEHGGYRALRATFPKLREALILLAQSISESELIKIGLSDFGSSDEDLREFIVVFTGAPTEVMKIAPLLRAIIGTENEDAIKSCRDCFVTNLRYGLDSERLGNILKYLEYSHINAPAEKKRIYISWFNRYLQEGFRLDELGPILGKINLLNQNGEWKQTSTLTWPMHGICQSNQLDQKQADMIRESREERRKPHLNLQVFAGEAEHGLREASEKIKKFFMKFESLVPREMIGAIGAILGDYKAIRDWSGRLLGDAAQVDIVRDEMFLKMKTQQMWTRESIRQAINVIQYECEVISTKKVKTMSIAGKEFEAAIDLKPKTFLVGDGVELEGAASKGRRILRLLDIKNIADFAPSNIEELFKNTLEMIAYHSFFCIERPDFSDLLQKLSQSGQRDVHNSQVTLLNVGDFYIKQLGCDKSPVLKSNIAKWDFARRCETDVDRFPSQEQMLLKRSRDMKMEAVKELKGILENSNDAHEVLLEGVRKKLKAYQYSHASIPFELFQNADDAYQEALLIGLIDDTAEHEHLFVIEENEGHLYFAHWGRPINYIGNVESNGRGEELGFDRDLDKMLTLSFSDKDLEGNSDVTGKFGLGFKSVYFASDLPEVASGRIAFRVRSGFYPVGLEMEEAQLLQQKLDNYKKKAGHAGTVIKLLRPSDGSSVLDEVMGKFESLIEILLLFAKQIKVCTLKRENGDLSNFRNATQQIGSQSFCKCHRPVAGIVAGKSLLMLTPVHRSKNAGSIVFGMGPTGFEKLPTELPSIWITAPTTERTSCGFIVNASFEPDVGRSQLARDSKTNASLTKDLCHASTESYHYLYEQTNDNFSEVAAKLQLSTSCTHIHFWESLWELLTSESMLSASKEQKGGAAQVMHDVIWGSTESGYLGFIRAQQVIPSNLPGKYSVLLSMPEIESYTDGLLDLDEIFCLVSTWPLFLKTYEAGKIVSGDRVFKKLKSLLPETGININKITLCDFVKKELGDHLEITPDFADRLGLLLDRTTYRKIKEGHIGLREERDLLNELTGSIKFKSEDWTYQNPKDLLSTRKIGETISSEEVLRSTIAPPDRRLSQDYSDAGILLFALFREKLDAPADLIARWVKESGHTVLRDIFNYLLNGELKHEVADKLGIRWAKEAFESDDGEALYAGDRTELLWLFRFGYLEKPDPPQPPPQPPQASFEHIYNWWSRNKARFLREYEREVFPGGVALSFTDDDIDRVEHDITSRKKWLQLLMMGSFYTMGRPSSGQHKGFLDLFEQKGWSDRLADPFATPESILGILDDYLSDPFADSTYYHWMKQFISFYQSSRWLTKYVYGLLQIDKRTEPFAIDKVFNMRKDTFLTGSGMDAPPLDRALGIGTCFVVRELLRCGFLKNEYAYEHAFVPRRRILDIFFGGVDTSKEIYGIIKDALGSEKAHFSKCFDIPFAVLAKHPEYLHDLPEVDLEILPESEGLGYFDDK